VVGWRLRLPRRNQQQHHQHHQHHMMLWYEFEFEFELRHCYFFSNLMARFRASEQAKCRDVCDWECVETLETRQSQRRRYRMRLNGVRYARCQSLVMVRTALRPRVVHFPATCSASLVSVLAESPRDTQDTRNHVPCTLWSTVRESTAPDDGARPRTAK
jgi:hypothetical protein